MIIWRTLPAAPSFITEPVLEQFHALLPERTVSDPRVGDPSPAVPVLAAGHLASAPTARSSTATSVEVVCGSSAGGVWPRQRRQGSR
jgi:hypothetical protein